MWRDLGDVAAAVLLAVGAVVWLIVVPLMFLLGAATAYGIPAAGLDLVRRRSPPIASSAAGATVTVPESLLERHLRRRPPEAAGDRRQDDDADRQPDQAEHQRDAVEVDQ